MNDLVSVIVPVYNVEKYLDKCVQSIVTQTYTNLEIIMVDDGSPDNCPKMCDEWARKDSRIKVIHKENAGVSSARNEGLDFAKGKWVMFVDADDIVSKDIIIMLLENTNSEDTLALCCMCKNQLKLDKYNENVECKIYTIDDIIESDIEKIDQSFNVNFTSPWARIFSLNIIKINNLKFSEKVIYGEDYVFNLNYWIKISNIKIIKFIGYYYRTNSNSISSNHKSDAYSEKMKISRELFSKEINFIYQTYFSHININSHNTNVSRILNRMLAIPLDKIKENKTQIINLSKTLENELFPDETAKNYSRNKFARFTKGRIIKYARSHDYKKLIATIYIYRFIKELVFKFR